MQLKGVKQDNKDVDKLMEKLKSKDQKITEMEQKYAQNTQIFKKKIGKLDDEIENLELKVMEEHDQQSGLRLQLNGIKQNLEAEIEELKDKLKTTQSQPQQNDESSASQDKANQDRLSKLHDEIENL